MIILVGLPGSGKSTVGRQLARRLSAEFVDTDQVIERSLGCSIRAYFEREGEQAFRDLEERTLAGLLAHQDPASVHQVLATGGGAVLRERNRQCLRSAGQVIYLRSNPQALFRRLRHDHSRPLLQVDDPVAKLDELFHKRDPLYQETAHIRVDTGGQTVASVVGEIMRRLGLAAAPVKVIGR